ncbi:MAG: hypothetical protein H6Q41_5431 [Deltaproteobacteria bacterium]|nr:hypothetical protein [Deltaproteobacteria bacterium]
MKRVMFQLALLPRMSAGWIRMNQVLLNPQNCYVAEKERKSESVSILGGSKRIVNRKNFTRP